MAICKFFLQGDCKFGDNCRFEHQVSSTSGSNNSPFGNVQNQQFQPKPANEVDTNTLVTSVHNDMVAVEKCGQWLLSCYAPFKEKQLFPGFQDQSFEEVRWGCYDAQRTNTFEQYNQQLQQALLEAKGRFKALQTPTKEMIAMLRTIYNTPPSSSETYSRNQNSVFGSATQQNNTGIFGQTTQNFNQNSSNIFGQNTLQNNATSPFGQQNQNANIFGQNQSVFGQNSATSSIFGQNTTQQNANSVFANANQSIFGANTTTNNGNPFNNQPSVFQQNQPSVLQQNQPQSLFPGNNQVLNSFTPAQAQSSIFSQINNDNQQNQSVFASSPFGNMSSENQNAQPNPMFTQQTPSNSIFASQNTQPIFNQNTNPLFSAQTQANPVFNATPQVESKSIFGNSQSNNLAGNVFGGQNSAIDHELYSKIDELSEADVNWFKSNDLDIKNMPTKPPTYEMCFS